MKSFPFASEQQLVEKATEAWYHECGGTDWLQSFTHHPEIGDAKSLAEKFAVVKNSGCCGRFGRKPSKRWHPPTRRIKIPGSSLLYSLPVSRPVKCWPAAEPADNNADEEIRIAMGEQHKITLLRFQKLLTNANFQFLRMSHLTT